MLRTGEGKTTFGSLRGLLFLTSASTVRTGAEPKKPETRRKLVGVPVACLVTRYNKKFLIRPLTEAGLPSAVAQRT